MARKYTLKRRAERQAETRRRIVEAVVALHEEVGPARTTITAIAERASVERVTVYQHFPDEASLFQACKACFDERHPLPDLTPWVAIADPVARVRHALTEVYAYFRATEAMLDQVFRDAPRVPAIQPVMATTLTYWEQALAILLVGWQPSEDQRPLLLAGLGHALDFHAWQSLARRQGVTDEQAITLMVRLVTCEGAREGPP